MIYQTALEWDVVTWSRALDDWASAILERGIVVSNGLELGARNGGLSWYFAQVHGSHMTCTDLASPSEKAQNLHQLSGLSNQIRYEQADARQLPFADEQFDFVVFKSMLGALDDPAAQQQAIEEMHRVLKPGGVLFFAENLRGSLLHQWARRKFMPWGTRWRYVTFQELDTFLSIFAEKKLLSTGFFSAFIPKPASLKNIVAYLDQLCYFVPQNCRYVGYGFAIK
jgi:ubiquinone/menaquinone biosynthesis C-methylase UbiE